jgi:hypothetical protein
MGTNWIEVSPLFSPTKHFSVKSVENEPKPSFEVILHHKFALESEGFPYMNPLRQNYKHTQTLGTLLGLESSLIYSVVVFVGESTFKTPMPLNVTDARGCVEYIKSKTTSVLSTAQVREICSSIQRGALRKGFTTDRMHVKHVQEIIRSKR